MKLHRCAYLGESNFFLNLSVAIICFLQINSVKLFKKAFIKWMVFSSNIYMHTNLLNILANKFFSEIRNFILNIIHN